MNVETKLNNTDITETKLANLQAFVNNVFAMLGCEADDLDEGVFELNKLIEKNHRLMEIIAEIHEANCKIPFHIYAKYL